MTEVIRQKIHKIYANWADELLQILDERTPREAIKTPEGLAQVKFLLHTYENGEAKQAQEQGRESVCMTFFGKH